jgi:hypothetical protein
MNGLTWLLKIALPTRNVFLNDGGVTTWAGDTYRASDEFIGSLASVGAITEGVGEQIPALDIGFAPPNSAAMTELTTGAFRQSPVTLYLAEYNQDTGAVVGTPENRWSGNLDKARVSFAFRELSIGIECSPQLEVVFFKDNGNGLSATFHKQLYPGETGHDQATGLSTSVFWGVSSPAQNGRVSGGGGSFGGDGFGGSPGFDAPRLQ